MRVEILRDRVLTPSDRRTSVKFTAGTEVTTKREWGAQLVADGDAREVPPPARPSSITEAT